MMGMMSENSFELIYASDFIAGTNYLFNTTHKGLRKPVYSVCCIKVARYLTLDIDKAEVSARHGKVYCQRNDCIRYSHDAWVDDVS